MNEFITMKCGAKSHPNTAEGHASSCPYCKIIALEAENGEYFSRIEVLKENGVENVKLQARVKELEDEVDMLRCCENCKNTDVGVDGTPCMLCTRVSVYKTADKPRMTDNWESCYLPTEGN